MISTKINSGSLGGRILQLPPQTVTRAVSSKVRATIFNKLEVQSRRVLDIFAGGGTLGFEAISHGASEVTFVDRSELAIKVIKSNAKSLGVEKLVKIKKSEARKFINNLGLRYDIIFLDPPYAEFNNTLVKSTSNLLQLGGILVSSCSSRFKLDDFEGLTKLAEKNYGDTKIVYFQKT
jgi:16S rRNA (guanine966-N2)-methyltransferase